MTKWMFRRLYDLQAKLNELEPVITALNSRRPVVNAMDVLLTDPVAMDHVIQIFETSLFVDLFS